MKGVHIPDNLLTHIQEEASRVHHGRIIIDINSDRPDKIDVITESRERFKGKPTSHEG